jgi:hypothetical protein
MTEEAQDDYAILVGIVLSLLSALAWACFK